MKRRDFLALPAAAPMLASVPEISFAEVTQFPTAKAYVCELIADEQFNGAVTLIHRQGKPDFVDVAGTMDGEKKLPMLRIQLVAGCGGGGGFAFSLTLKLPFEGAPAGAAFRCDTMT